MFLLTWTPWIFAAHYSYRPGMSILSNLFALLGLLGPFFAALIMTWCSGSRDLKRDFKDRLVSLRLIKPGYLLITLLLMPLALFLSTALSVVVGRSADQFRFSGGLAAMLPIILLAPTFEELGWRGYGMDSLRAKFGMLPATLLFALLWAMWHVPLFFIDHNYQHGLWEMSPIYVVNFFVSVVPAAILINWLYYKNNRSIVLAILFHMALDATSEAFQTEQFTKCIVTGVLLVISIVVIAADRAFFFEEKKSFV
ncbi:MAG: CPBP family intramembrane glutamic endopeptidase [Candidatus Binatus sp.]